MSLRTTTSNISFSALRKSNEFLGALIDNLTCCILMLDKNLELYAINDAVTTIFPLSVRGTPLYKKCGNTIGCAYAVEESRNCGRTSQCKFCEIRIAALTSYVEKRNVNQQVFSKEFYTVDNIKELKHLRFSTRLFTLNGERYILLVIDDVSKFVELESKIEIQMKEIAALEEKLHRE